MLLLAESLDLEQSINDGAVILNTHQYIFARCIGVYHKNPKETDICISVLNHIQSFVT